jgi:cysteinyl-tRNA synthetase
LKAASKGFNKLLNAFKILPKLVQNEPVTEPNEKLIKEISEGISKCYAGMNDDFNTGITIAGMFSLAKPINTFFNGQANINSIPSEVLNDLKFVYSTFFENVLGLKDEANEQFKSLADEFLEIYKLAKVEKQYEKVDQIRSIFKSRGLVIKDMKQGIDWGYEE